MRARIATLAISLHAASYLPLYADATPAMHTNSVSREALSRHYSNFPDPYVTQAFKTSLTRIRDTRQRAVEKVPEDVRLDVLKIIEETVPPGLDSAMYSLRCACEEAAERAESPGIATRLTAVAGKFETFQHRQRAHVTAVVESFLPSDFRKSLFDTFRNRSERADADAIRELLQNGGSVRDKYNLLWQQQWRRREALSSIGNATGVWRWLMRFLAGVPLPLLTFAREINAPNGLTEALRMKFSGVLRELVVYAVEINALLVVTKENPKILEEGLNVYEDEVERFVTLLEEVITKSPFFIRAEEVEN